MTANELISAAIVPVNELSRVEVNALKLTVTTPIEASQVKPSEKGD